MVALQAILSRIDPLLHWGNIYHDSHVLGFRKIAAVMGKTCHTLSAHANKVAVILAYLTSRAEVEKANEMQNLSDWSLHQTRFSLQGCDIVEADKDMDAIR